jgi:hypothetical protein
MWALRFRDNPSAPLHALMSMVGIDERRGRWVVKSDWAYDLKDAGYKLCNQNPPYGVFPATVDLKSPPPNRVAPLAAAGLPNVIVELQPPLW